jgi:hypothetical protein
MDRQKAQIDECDRVEEKNSQKNADEKENHGKDYGQASANGKNPPTQR